MEELLNKIIEKGWKPRDIETLYIEVKLKYGELHLILPQMGNLWKPIRLLVSKESGLWQFVCENQMIRVTEKNSLCNWLFGEELYYDETQTDKLYKNDNYQYWLIESALCDEDKLEQFLIDNIEI